MFIAGDRPSQLTAQLERCHLGHAFTHVGVNRPEDAARFEHLGSAVVDDRAIPVGGAGTVGVKSRRMKGPEGIRPRAEP